MGLKKRCFWFKGYQGYADIQDQVETLFKELFQEENPLFNIAVNEAVLNASRYAKAGISEASITMEVLLSPVDIRVTVESDTYPTDFVAYKKKLKRLADNVKIGVKDWSEFTGLTDASRGFWLMLTVCDYVIVESDGSSVTLSAKIPFNKDKPIDKTIGFLVDKFFVRTGGVSV